MSAASLQEALNKIRRAEAEDPHLLERLVEHWRSGPAASVEDIPPSLVATLEQLEEALPDWLASAPDEAELAPLLHGPGGEILFSWCSAKAPQPDVVLAPFLTRAAALGGCRERAQQVARRRTIEGPLSDALICATLLGSGQELMHPENRQARARLEILIWEAGASALSVPELGHWLWGGRDNFEVLVGRPANRSLRERVLAARCLEVAASGISPQTPHELVGRTLQVMQPLLLHPEPLVWVHAARSFGRLAGVFEPLEGTVLDWVHGPSEVLRQRALTAFASFPAHRLSFLGHELRSILERPDAPPSMLAAAALATPHLFREKRALWELLARRILSGDGGAVAAWALARGLASLWRAGTERDVVEAPIRTLRHMARRARTNTVDTWRAWLGTIAVTDPVDAAERDPLDLELGLENLVRLAAQYEDEEADARAARFAGTLASTFAEARRIALGSGSLRHRAAALNAVEACGRSLALRLWAPLLVTRPKGDPIAEPDLSAAWEAVAQAPSELLDIVNDHRDEGTSEEGFDAALEVLALKLGGYALDACGETRELGPGRGPTAHATCLWLRKLRGLTDGSREVPPRLRRALSAILWRLVDTTRGTSLGEVDDVEWLGPFAAWWALVIDRPTVLQQLATALPMIADGALDTCCGLAEEIRAAFCSEQPAGSWGPAALGALTDLYARDTELAAALSAFADALHNFSTVRAGPDLEASCSELVFAAERLRASLTDPVRALHRVGSDAVPADDAEDQQRNATRMASVVARAIRARDITRLEVWFASLGATASTLVEAAVASAIRRSPPPPPAPAAPRPKTMVGYELVKPLGEGGVGTVWLVRKPGADRLFVLKIPKAEALEAANETEREGILSSFVSEARALAGLYHPNVANIIDRGVADGVPYLVIEYLIGADLGQYAAARRMTLFELRKCITETCAGLTALHNAGLVHRDIKPANIWLRLPLPGGAKFDPAKHRDPVATPPLSSVVIDFGMVRACKVAPEVGGRFVAGTPGYIAPEQVLDPVELDGRADVYALVGTIYNVTTGRTFFDDISDRRERILAHMQRDPFEGLLQPSEFPAGLWALMRAGTARDWKDRPTASEFAREFVAAL